MDMANMKLCVHSQPSKPFLFTFVPQLNILKMTRQRKRFSATEVLSQIVQGGSDIDEDMSETEDYVEEDPDYAGNEASEIGHSDPPLVSQAQFNPLVISQPPRTDKTSKNGKLPWSGYLMYKGRIGAVMYYLLGYKDGQ